VALRHPGDHSRIGHLQEQEGGGGVPDWKGSFVTDRGLTMARVLMGPGR
jgi:hypothetical protein